MTALRITVDTADFDRLANLQNANAAILHELTPSDILAAASTDSPIGQAIAGAYAAAKAMSEATTALTTTFKENLS